MNQLSVAGEQPWGAEQAQPRPAGWQRTLARLAGAEESPLHLALIVLLLGIGVVLHYGDWLPILTAAADRSPVSLATRQSLERVLFLIPVMYAALVFKGRGGLIALAIAAAILIPRAVVSSAYLDHSISEVVGVTTVGALLVGAITQQRNELEAQKRMRESLHQYVWQVLSAQEDERRRISLELHDETAQALLLTCQRLDRLTSVNRNLPEPVAEELRALRASTVETLTDLRRLTQNLRPRILDDHGLVPALEWLADHLREQYAIETQVHSNPLPGCSSQTQLLLFRVAQEALRNVARHSGATRATVSVAAVAGRIHMEVADNGRGFRFRELGDLARKGQLGLLGIQERVRLLGGDLDIRSFPGKGTTVAVSVPAAARPAQ